MDNTLAAAGLKDIFSLVLFGGELGTRAQICWTSHRLASENAALPHGSGTDRELGEGDFALIDCGGSLHGYQSDVTRVSALQDWIHHIIHEIL